MQIKAYIHGVVVRRQQNTPIRILFYKKFNKYLYKYTSSTINALKLCSVCVFSILLG